MPKLESLIPARVVRKILDISPSAEINLRRQSTLPEPIRIGRANFYLREELEERLGIKDSKTELEASHA